MARTFLMSHGGADKTACRSRSHVVASVSPVTFGYSIKDMAKFGREERSENEICVAGASIDKFVAGGVVSTN